MACQPTRLPIARPSGLTQRVDLVAMAVSTGGPNALEKLIPALPADFPVAITLVQHMPPIFTKTLAQRLSSLSKIPVHEGAPGDIVRRGGVWLAPGGYHMYLTRRIAAVQIHTNQSPPENSCRPSADVLFRSVAELFGPRALGRRADGNGRGWAARVRGDSPGRGPGDRPG